MCQGTSDTGWLTGANIVCRAVGLIQEGALDGDGEDAFARKCGVSSRHLRRLFRQSLGVTPSQLARANRIRRARQMLDETDFTVADIAHASGFGSVRQLNRVSRDYFGMNPIELRSQLPGPGDESEWLTLRMPSRSMFGWLSLLGHMAQWAVPGVESVHGSSYRRTITVNGLRGVLELLRPRTGGMVVRLHLPDWQDLLHVVERIGTILSPAVNGGGDHPSSGAGLREPLIAERSRLNLPGSWDPFEVGLVAVIADKQPRIDALRAVGRLVAALGTRLDGIPYHTLTHTFPSPDSVAASELARVGFDASTEFSVREFACGVSDGSISLDPGADVDALVGTLISGCRIEARTARYIAIRAGLRLRPGT